VQSCPAVANGVVYVGSDDGNFYALNASTGAKLWSYAAGGPDSSPEVANGVVYFSTPNGTVYALNASTGAKLWTYTAGNGLEVQVPAVANGVVYVGSDDSNVYALNASTGAKLWTYTTTSSVESVPAVANGVVYIGSTDGNMYALNASTGAKLWSSTAASGTPAVVNGTLYVGGSAFSVGADLYLRIIPTTTTVHQGDLITYAFPVWNLGPDAAAQEVLKHAGACRDSLRLHPHLRYAGAGHVLVYALPGSRADPDRLPRKRRHGVEHHMDSAIDGEGDRARRHGDHRKRGHHGGYARSQPGQ
jgi:hypothetical protein